MEMNIQLKYLTILIITNKIQVILRQHISLYHGIVIKVSWRTVRKLRNFFQNFVPLKFDLIVMYLIPVTGKLDRIFIDLIELANT